MSEQITTTRNNETKITEEIEPIVIEYNNFLGEELEIEQKKEIVTILSAKMVKMGLLIDLDELKDGGFIITCNTKKMNTQKHTYPFNVVEKNPENQPIWMRNGFGFSIRIGENLLVTGKEHRTKNLKEKAFIKLLNLYGLKTSQMTVEFKDGHEHWIKITDIDEKPCDFEISIKLHESFDDKDD